MFDSTHTSQEFNRKGALGRDVRSGQVQLLGHIWTNCNRNWLPYKEIFNNCNCNQLQLVTTDCWTSYRKCNRVAVAAGWDWLKTVPYGVSSVSPCLYTPYQ